MRKKYTIIMLSIVVIILFILSGFITTRHTVKFPCRFISQAEWSVHVDDPEKVYVEFKRNDKNTLERFDCYHFSRPDLIRFEVEPDVAVGRYLDAGKIVANIHSQEDAYRFESLKTEIETVQAELELLSTGEKKEVREEAKQALLYAQAQLEAYQPQLDRKKDLLEKNLISQQDLELAEAENNLYKINVSLQKARLKAAESGEKQEQIDYVKKELAGLEAQFGLLLNKKKAEALVTPISGIVGDCNEAGVVCQINKIDTLIVQIPVTEEYLHQLKPGQKVEIILPHSHYEQLECRIVRIGNQAYFINGQSMFIIYCNLANTNKILFNGSTGYAKIHYGESSLYKQITSHWNNYKYRKLAFLK